MKGVIRDLYFEWLYEMMCGGRYGGEMSYRELLLFLHSVDFRYIIEKDENRESDGKDLRYRFLLFKGYDTEKCYDFLDDPCSVFEMMVALAIRCEENIMDDPEKGNRTAQWFWRMVHSLGLGAMTDDRFDKHHAEHVVERFLDREYAPNGRGGLFTINNCSVDLRNVEIWYQLCWYLDVIT